MRYASCHPDRPHRCRGLCNACYQRAKAKADWVRIGRPARVNTCGHPERKHTGNGLCGTCRTRARRARLGDEDKQSRRDYWLRAKYGISLADFNAIFETQGFACALCRKGIPKARHRHVDHCHSTGRVRGVLCFDCNKALGLLGDTPEAIARALAYVSGERIAAKAGVFIPMERAA